MNDVRRVQAIRDIFGDPFGGRGLTDRQATVAYLAAIGCTTEEIAERLGIPRNTVGSHMRDVKRKLGLGKFGLTKDLVERVRKALE